MSSVDTSIVSIVRRFNRFYTNVLGLLDQHILNSEFSLSEARVLFEIENTENCTAKMLIDQLNLDAGYLSRILKRFEKQGISYRIKSNEDGRSYYLFLTDQGKDILSKLDTMSEEQVRQLVNNLPEQHQRHISKHMMAIENVLSDNSHKVQNVHIRSDLKPGDVGFLIHLHGWVYAKECGYNHVFEGYVCKTFYEFFEKYSPDKDRFWFAEVGGEIVGAIAIVGHSSEKAQLRWFILHPEFRGIGLGRTLLQEALDYCKERKYQTVFLETTEDQKKAIQMYQNVGFKKTAEREDHSWGVSHTEEVYELSLI
ncbi:GNAT family N-acetyltransferase [Paenibacillus sp. NPDC057934]|uniref:bifunctional helix-turn-helix transcriptional regulator/GNAT family N-acetyltransferase n=1 Tax=Paenibacillus sp. NPDC057934 TaxID=3346282 RepID=UPI0036DAECED